MFETQVTAMRGISNNYNYENKCTIKGIENMSIINWETSICNILILLHKTQ